MKSTGVLSLKLGFRNISLNLMLFSVCLCVPVKGRKGWFCIFPPHFMQPETKAGLGRAASFFFCVFFLAEGRGWVRNASFFVDQIGRTYRGTRGPLSFCQKIFLKSPFPLCTHSYSWILEKNCCFWPFPETNKTLPAITSNMYGTVLPKHKLAVIYFLFLIFHDIILIVGLSL